MRKFSNPTTTSIAVLFPTVVRFNLLEFWHSHKNKPFTISFFKKPYFIFVATMIVYSWVPNKWEFLINGGDVGALGKIK